MGASAHPARGQSARPHTRRAVPPVPPRRVVPRSNLLDALIEARKAESRSVANLAAMAGIPARALRAVEAGKGPVRTLVAVLEALPFQIVGLAPGRDLAEQLRNRRLRRGMSVAAVAAKAGMASNEVLRLEGGAGTVKGLLRLLAVIAPTIRRRAPERAYWGGADKADRDSRFTPVSFMEPLCDAFGEVDIDPCGHVQSPVRAGRRFLLEQGDDGLADAWSGRFAFVNPPYSRLLDWLRRAHDQWRAGNVGTAVCLVPVRTDSDFFQVTVKADADLYFLRGRVRFLDRAGRPQSTPHSLMIVVFGATARQRDRFAELVPGFWVPAGIGATSGAVVDFAEYRHRVGGGHALNNCSAWSENWTVLRPRAVCGPN